ncbi:diamine N-acetyltransferase [Clostridium punense]|uniref:Diamine N-acetyltransferase n=1 Tax=Clostridium punense TaxID=1054297 RepID=A0ABS4K6K9_9CLOT|nr:MULTISPECIES: GNAT family N-acetyltransferase [Clostridium]EQB89864.1 hypothetical protein M918_18550 [Clostridium sp. BL8]MBP2023418.1 diamine N-acetyltransferase [Clostridium punense]
MRIYFKEITIENWEECIELKVSREQEKYLPHSNLKSIAEWKFNPHWTALGIYIGDNMIGFSMYGTLHDDDPTYDGTMWIMRLMIDERYQGNGYGKLALSELIKIIKNQGQHKDIWISFHPESKTNLNLYSHFGFKQVITGFEAEDEVFYKLEL